MVEVLEFPAVALVKALNHFSLLNARKRIAKQFLHGSGVEIGALSRPLAVPSNAHVRYVDRYDASGLRKHYPELRWRRLVNVDVIDNGETLATIPDASLNFIIANHMLEHCENPLGTIRNHLRCLQSGGVLYYAIPEKTQTFDTQRPVTEISHFIKDDAERPDWSRKRHYLEWATYVSGKSGQEAEREAERLMREKYSIHFHVWDTASLFAFWAEFRKSLGFNVLHFERNFNEVVSVLAKS